MVDAIAFLRDNVLHPDTFVDLFDKALVEENQRAGDLEAATFATTVERILADKLDLLQSLSKRLQEVYQQTEQQLDHVPFVEASSETSNPQNFAHSPIFVDNSTSAVMVPSWSSDSTLLNYEVALSQNLEELFLDNVNKDRSIAFQYFGGPFTGITRYYPHFQWESTDVVDARLSPWYVGAITGAKGLVLILDTSSDIGQDFDYVKQASINVIRSLHEADHIMLLIISDNELQKPSCVGQVEGYVRATPQAIDAFVAAIAALEPSQVISSAYSKEQAFLEAFAIFERESQDHVLDDNTVVPGRGTQACQNALIFVGSGKNLPKPERLTTDSSALPTMLLYTIGATQNDRASQLACSSTGSAFSFAQGDGISLQKNITHYSTFLGTVGQNNQEEPAWHMSLGFTNDDKLQMGVVMSVSMPVYPAGSGENGDLATPVGVLGMDFVFDDLIFAEESFEVRFDYGFLVNTYGDTVLHPVMRDRSQRYSFQDTTSPPLYYDISTYEPTPEFNTEVRDPMFVLQAGQVRVQQDVDLPAGDTAYEGLARESVNTTYFWQQLASFPFVAVRAISDERLNLKIFRPSSYHRTENSDDYFYYYRIDDYQNIPAPNRSYHGNGYGNISGVNFDYGNFKYAPKGWLDPQAYLAHEVDLIDQVMEYVNEAPGAVNPGIEEEAKYDTQIVWPIFDQWIAAFKDPAIIDHYKLIWIYVGSPLGSIHSFPTGADTTPDFDTSIRPWRDRAASQPDKVVLSSPYVDGFGMGKVIALAMTTKSQGVSHVGVLGLDFGYKDLQDTLFNRTNCWEGYDDGDSTQRDAKCFLFDQSGLLLVDPDFVQSDDVTNVFLGIKAGEVAQSLLEKGFLYQHNQLNLQSNPPINQTVFVVNDTMLQGDVLEGELAPGGCLEGRYVVVPIRGAAVATTMFLVVIHSYQETGLNCTIISAPPANPVNHDTCTEVTTEYKDRRTVLPTSCPPPLIPSALSLEKLRQTFGADTCQVPKETTWVEWSDPVAIVFLSLLFLISFVAVVVAAYFVYYTMSSTSSEKAAKSKSTILRQTGYLFNFGMLVGLALAALAILPFIGEPTDTTCAVRPWMSLFWVFIYGNLVAKLAFMFRSKLKQKEEGLLFPTYSWIQVLVCNAALLSIELLILILWTAVDPQKPEVEETVDSDKNQLLCRSEHHPVWLALQYLYMAVLLVAGLSLSVLVGRTPTRFDEARWTSFALYGTTIATVITVIAYSLLEPSIPDAALALLGFGVLLGMAAVLLLLFFTKLFRIAVHRKRGGDKAVVGGQAAKFDVDDDDDGLDDL
ncbi:hypothetical protein QOT17_001653 [Balamuthia mandrillaris]